MVQMNLSEREIRFLEDLLFVEELKENDLILMYASKSRYQMTLKRFELLGCIKKSSIAGIWNIDKEMISQVLAKMDR